MAPARLLGVVGPTASGKTTLAIEIARECDGEIVSCDSLQVYRRLDIGSAKPTAAERAAVQHHLIDVVDIWQDFSAAAYAAAAREAVREIVTRGRRPLVVGGTGLYLRAFLHGLFPGPGRDEALRGRLEAMADRFGNARLHRLLGRHDPVAARRIRPSDRLRVVRALEVLCLSGRPMSEQQGGGEQPLHGFETLLVGLVPPRAELRLRVRERAECMLRDGLVEEVRRLLEEGVPPDARPLRSIGYRQAVSVLQGQLEESAALEAIVTDTMRYAKRQMTWFRHQADVAWFEGFSPALQAGVRWLRGGPGV
jgi:tRNA dimethylallyltransferase